MMKATNQTYVLEIKQILNSARKKAYSAVNTAMIEAYWLVGKRIVEEEQNGNKNISIKGYILKLGNNSVVGKTCEHSKNRIVLKLTTSNEQTQL